MLRRRRPGPRADAVHAGDRADARAITYYVAILRGIILRGAGRGELWPPVLPLLAHGIVVFAFASMRFARATR